MDTFDQQRTGPGSPWTSHKRWQIPPTPILLPALHTRQTGHCLDSIFSSKKFYRMGKDTLQSPWTGTLKNTDI